MIKMYARKAMRHSIREDAEKSDEEDYRLDEQNGSLLRDVWLFFFAQQSFKGDLQAECVIKWVHIMSIKMVVCIIC